MNFKILFKLIQNMLNSLIMRIEFEKKINEWEVIHSDNSNINYTRESKLNKNSETKKIIKIKKYNEDIYPLY